MSRPRSAGALAALLLILIASASTLALALGPAREPHGRLVEDGRGLGGGGAALLRTRATPPTRAPPRPAATSPLASHQQHENPLEAVRFDLAAASLRRLRPDEKGVVGAGGGSNRNGGPLLLRLAVNASFAAPAPAGGSDKKDQQQHQVIHASPSTRAAEHLKVSWSGLLDPRPDDLVAVLLLQEKEDGGGPAELSSAAPAKFSLLASKAATNGSLELRLANYLSPYVAVGLFRGGIGAPKLAEGASLVVLRNGAHPLAPLHRRLALASSSGDNANNNGTVALSVRWTTRAPGGSPGVWWTDEPPGKSGENGNGRRYYKRFAAALGPAPLTYSREEMCGGDAREVGYAHPGYFHTAIMTGLVPGRTYWYVVGDGGGDEGESGGNANPPPEESVRSPEAPFVAPPSPSSSSSSSSSVRVLVTADMGQAEPDGWSQTPDYTRAASVRTARALARELERRGGGNSNSAAATPSLVLHAGDISYARGYSALWTAFHDLVEPLASRIPYQVAPGNHEIDWPQTNDRFSAESGEAGARAQPPRPEGGKEADQWRAARGGKPARDVYDSGGECGVAYARRFAMPTNGAVLSPSSSGGGGNGGGGGKNGDDDESKPWYAFDHGPHARFVVFSTEHDFMPGSEQRAFIERAFAGARPESGGGTNKRWLVLVGHRPLHVCSSWDSFADSDGAVGRALRSSLDPLLARYGVDLTISGHHHSFGRTCAVVPSSASSSGGGKGGDEELGPTCAPEGEEDGQEGGGGVVHIVAGNGGAPISLNPSFPPSPIWKRLRYDWGYLRLDISAEKLVVETVESGSGTPEGEVVDRFELVRRRR